MTLKILFLQQINASFILFFKVSKNTNIINKAIKFNKIKVDRFLNNNVQNNCIN